MKIAYILLCHNEPDIVKRCVQALNYKDDHIFVHVDLKSDFSVFEAALKECLNATLISNRVKNYWGGYNSIVATINTLKAAMEAGKYDRFVLLQGKDYPIISPQAIHNFFEKHQNEEFCLAKDISVSTDPGDYMKCCGFWSMDGPSRGFTKILRPILFVLNTKIKIKYRSSCFKNGDETWHIYKGWAQFALTRECISYILDIYDRLPKYNHFMRHRFPPDEIYFHTIIYNSPFKDNITSYRLKPRDNALWFSEHLNLTYFEYPSTVTIFQDKEDYRSLYETGALFVRKVSAENSVSLLNYIDDHIL